MIEPELEYHYEYHDNGNTYMKVCCLSGTDVLHNTNDPASISYYENGNPEIESWYQNGKRHRLNGPARIVYNYDGSIVTQAWFENGIRHNINGPAFISYRANGIIWTQEWYKNGSIIDQKSYGLKNE